VKDDTSPEATLEDVLSHFEFELDDGRSTAWLLENKRDLFWDIYQELKPLRNAHKFTVAQRHAYPPPKGTHRIPKEIHVPYDTAAAIIEVVEELQSARIKFPPFHSAHEGYAVLKEEVDELWTEIKRKHQIKPDMRHEAVQTAAMAIRFLLDVQ
jgi:hypothetical protein